MHIKTLHIYLIKKYIPPFLATLFIAMFIFFMIFIFTYIDEIAGKGIDNITLAKTFGYIFIQNLPISMPLAVLLSSIMTFGNLGENYELAAMKSAGLSLLAIMRPLLVFILGLAIFCFLFCNYTLPYVRLKATRLLYDVRSSKPAISIKESVFYNEIKGYSIRIGRKDNDGVGVHNVLIYDHTAERGNTTQMYAKDGEISMSADRKFLNIKLFNGTHYEQPMKDAREEHTRPNMIMHFKEQEIKIDLSKIKMQQTDEAFFKNNAQMMDLRLLAQYKDTATKYRALTYLQTFKQFTNAYYFQKSLLQIKRNDSLKTDHAISINAYLNKLPPANKKNVVDGALNLARSADAFLTTKVEEENNQIKDEAAFAVEWHEKFTIACTCIILFFVGAPLGAIVRKGGFGMPVVISVFMFIIYHVISFTCKKMVMQNQLNVIVGMWINAAIFLPIGCWLSLKAAKDSPLFDAALYSDFFKKVFKRKKMKLLQLTNKPPYPPNDGSSIAVYNMTCGLLNNHVDVTLMCINTKKHFKADDEVDAAFRKDSHYTSVYHDTDVTAFGALANLFSAQSYFVSRFYFKDFEEKLISILKEKTFDVIQLESIFLGNYMAIIKKYSKAKITVRTHNAEHLIWERMIANENNFIKKKYLSLQTKRLKSFEKKVLQSADAIVPITEIDKNYFENWGINKLYHVSPTGIQLQQYEVNHTTELPGSVFHFGSMDWMPNEEAVLWFINNVWEKVLTKIPHAKFYVIGRGMSPKMLALNKPNVVIIGKIQNAQKVYHHYSVMVVPLLSGSGMRIKMIEGMAYAKAIVSTTIGAEGIAVTAHKNCLMADDASNFAGAVIEILSNKEKRNALQQEARNFIEQNFENTGLVKQLVEFYKTL